MDKKVLNLALEYDEALRKLENNTKQKQIENENSLLIQSINKLDRDVRMAESKIVELNNTKDQNRKYLLDEEIEHLKHKKINISLNDELDNLSKLTEETLKLKVKENERMQSIIIKNKTNNNDFKFNSILTSFKAEEQKARELLEEKNTLQQKKY